MKLSLAVLLLSLVSWGLLACGDAAPEAPSAEEADVGSSDASEEEGGEDSQEEPSLPMISPTCFEAASQEPQLRYGDLLPEASWNDPHVFKEGDRYIMYASASRGFVNLSVHIYRLTSQDGRSWALDPEEPVLSPQGESHGVETPSVVYFGGRYHLFYTTYPGELSPTEFTIGHATSDDGVQWQVETSARIAPSGESTDWNGLIVGEPAAVVYRSRLYLYFTAVGIHQELGSTDQVIGLVTSDDGESFSEPSEVLSLDRQRWPRGEGWVGLSTPAAVVLGEELHLFTDVSSDAPDPDYLEDWLQVALFHAWSPDGRTQWQRDSDFLHTRGELPWTQREIRSVSPLLDGDQLRLWYAGDEVYSLNAEGEPVWSLEKWGIGMSVCR